MLAKFGTATLIRVKCVVAVYRTEVADFDRLNYVLQAKLRKEIPMIDAEHKTQNSLKLWQGVM